MVGPNTGLSGAHGGAMGESWSDLAATEILNEYGFVPIADENRFASDPTSRATSGPASATTE